MSNIDALNLTAPQHRALEAVRDGKCYRNYSREGKTVHGKGVSGAVLMRLERAAMINETNIGDDYRRPFVLTDFGRKTLCHRV